MLRVQCAVPACRPGEGGRSGAQQLTTIRNPVFANGQGIRVRRKKGYELGQWDVYGKKNEPTLPFKVPLKETRPASSFLP